MLENYLSLSLFDQVYIILYSEISNNRNEVYCTLCEESGPDENDLQSKRSFISAIILLLCFLIACSATAGTRSHDDASPVSFGQSSSLNILQCVPIHCTRIVNTNNTRCSEN